MVCVSKGEAYDTTTGKCKPAAGGTGDKFFQVRQWRHRCLLLVLFAPSSLVPFNLDPAN